MPTEVTYSYDRIIRRVAGHLKNPEAMQAFFATIYGKPPVQPARPADRDRWRRIEECPACVVIGDIFTLNNFLVDFADASNTRDGFVNLKMHRDEACNIRHSLDALITLNGTAKGPAILTSLAQLLPREIKPRKLVRQLRHFLRGDLANTLRRELDSVLNAHHTN